VVFEIQKKRSNSRPFEKKKQNNNQNKQQNFNRLTRVISLERTGD
jgi:hypothetical protein